MISGHQDFFFEQYGGQDIFFPFFPLSTLLHLCCMQFFSSDKRLQEIFFQAEDGIRDRSPSRGLGDVYKRQS